MKEEKLKLCILAAGKGTRNRSIEGLHKALLPLSNKPAISIIIEKFPKDIPIIIILGYKSNQISTYCNLVHSDRKIEYVYVDNFDGEGSGPGLSLLKSKKSLQCPFIFTSSDTIFESSESLLSIENNWVGSSRVSSESSHKYCLINNNKSNVDFYYSCNEEADAFIGIAGIKDYKDFWRGLSNKDLINGEHQVLNGLKSLKNISTKTMAWHDTGNIESYENAKKIFPNDIVLEKDNEAIFIDNGWVVKYFSNETKLRNRVDRAEQIYDRAPSILKVNKNMLAYKYIEGKMLSEIDDLNILKYFLSDYSSNFVRTASDYSSEKFLKNCTLMYENKTLKRIEKFKNSPLDFISNINGIEVEPVEKILEKVSWDYINKIATPTCFHGDLQPENILYSKKYSRFYYIDWRESFGESIDVGDIYYDLGKMYHALIISNSLIQDGNFKVKVDTFEKSAKISFLMKSNLVEMMRFLKIFCDEKGYDFENVRLLGILNYLNIASLYDNFKSGEYGKFLFLLGKKMLTEWISDNEKSSRTN
mgnify:CR=1 FL=1